MCEERVQDGSVDEAADAYAAAMEEEQGEPEDADEEKENRNIEIIFGKSTARKWKSNIQDRQGNS